MHVLAYKQYIFKSYNTSTFSAMLFIFFIFFNENLFIFHSEKEDKKAYGFQILHLHWPFSSDVMVVKGLTNSLLIFVTTHKEDLSYPPPLCVLAQVPAGGQQLPVLVQVYQPLCADSVINQIIAK